MKPRDEDSHSFVIKIWIEEHANEAGKTTWRGHITHVQSSKRRYFENLNDITVILRSYLERMGVAFNWRKKIRSWIR